MSSHSIEFLYAEPVARALVDDCAFRYWVLAQSPFAHHADGARILHEEMLRKRSAKTRNWWQHHWRSKKTCSCAGCSDQETDLLAIFEARDGFRFGLLLEVKYPGDIFAHEQQARAYSLRAACWVKKAPQSVLRHSAAAVGLLCSETQLSDFEKALGYFDFVLTFEQIAARFPNATYRA